MKIWSSVFVLAMSLSSAAHAAQLCGVNADVIYSESKAENVQELILEIQQENINSIVKLCREGIVVKRKAGTGGPTGKTFGFAFSHGYHNYPGDQIGDDQDNSSSSEGSSVAGGECKYRWLAGRCYYVPSPGYCFLRGKNECGCAAR